jgi:hypothetical protein
MAATINSITGFVKDVRRNRETRDFDAYVICPDQEEIYLGSRARSWDAEQLCDEYTYAQLQHQPVAVEAVDDAETAEDIAAEIAEYQQAVKLYCLGLNDAGDQIIFDKMDGLCFMLGGAGMLAVQQEGNGKLHTFTREQTAAMYRFFQASSVQKRMLAIQRAVLIEHGHGVLVKHLEALIVAPAHPPTFPAPAAPAAPAIRIERLINDDTCDAARFGTEMGVDYSCGAGLTKALIGTGMESKLGIELIIGGSSVNSDIDQVLTLADVRELRDNLTALLGDARLVAACTRVEAGAPPKMAA